MAKLEDLKNTGELEGMDGPWKDHARTTAYAKLIMRELGLSQEEAFKMIDEYGLDAIVKQFQAKTPDQLEDTFETLKASSGKRGGLIKEIEEAE